MPPLRPPPSPIAKGLVLVLASALLTSTKAIFIKLSYPYGVDPLTLLALRMAFSLPPFVAMAVVEELRHARLPRDAQYRRIRDYSAVAGLGITGYYLASYFDFLGLSYVTAGLERLVLFSYPTFAVLLSAALFRQRITARESIALASSYIGILLAFGEERTTAGALALRGSAYVLLSAIFYAIYLVGSSRIMGRFGVNRLVAQASMVSCIAVLAHFFIERPASALRAPLPVYLYAAAIAVVATLVPVFLLGHGIRLIGASKASIATSVGPVSTIVLARIFLGEHFGLLQAIGTVFVVAGVLQLGIKKAPPIRAGEAPSS